MKGFTFRFYCGVSQRNSKIACALSTNKCLNWAEFQTGWILKIEIYEEWPIGSTRKKVGILIDSRKNKYGDTESIRGLETIAIQNYIFQYIYNKSVHGNYSSKECVNQFKSMVRK